MTPEIIDLPRIFMRVMEFDWDIDWGGQSSGRALDGSDQVVLNAFPRFVGAPTLSLPRRMIGHFRAIRARAKGHVNVWRVPMVDPVSNQMGGADWHGQWRAYVQGAYVEPRPTVRCTAAVLAGATSLIVDETTARRPVQVGAYLSYDDWPFIVTGRSGTGSAVTLQVELLRTDIPLNATIDLNARGLFRQTSAMGGNPVYGAAHGATAELSFSEWITR